MAAFRFGGVVEEPLLGSYFQVVPWNSFNPGCEGVEREGRFLRLTPSLTKMIL